MKRSFSTRISQILVLLFFVSLTAATIDLDNLFDYEGQITPVYITRDNQSMENVISNEGATLGRVLFYDKNLSLNNTISCGSCHKQEFAFSDTAVRSVGFEGGLTGRHSMRLINARFADEMRFFWDKRAESLEVQTTMPVQDHVEMGTTRF
jgi:cytochrome c peroxidase